MHHLQPYCYSAAGDDGKYSPSLPCSLVDLHLVFLRLCVKFALPANKHLLPTQHQYQQLNLSIRTYSALSFFMVVRALQGH